MLYCEIIAVCSQIHTKHINTLCGQNVELYIKTQSVPRSKHSVSVIKTSQLMLYREIIAVCSQIHTKHINTLCGQNAECLNCEPSVWEAPSGLWSDDTCTQINIKHCVDSLVMLPLCISTVTCSCWYFKILRTPPAVRGNICYIYVDIRLETKVVTVTTLMMTMIFIAINYSSN